MTRVTIRKTDGSIWTDEPAPVAFKPLDQPLPIDSLPSFTASTFDAVGYCIYCGVAGCKLGREHIVPFGLGGTLVLPASSCSACAGVTSAFERKVLRGPMWAVRAHLQLKSRHANLAPPTAQIALVRGGIEELVDLPLAEHPLFLMFPRFAEPSILRGNRTTGIQMRGHATYYFGRNPNDVVRAHGADDFRLSQDYAIVPFAQLLGKIAWSMAAADGRLKKVDRTEESVVDALITSPDDIGKWVGTFPEPPARQHGVLHAVAPMEISGHLVYHIQLFAFASTPRYAVVVGKLKEPFA